MGIILRILRRRLALVDRPAFVGRLLLIYVAARPVSQVRHKPVPAMDSTAIGQAEEPT